MCKIFKLTPKNSNGIALPAPLCFAPPYSDRVGREDIRKAPPPFPCCLSRVLPPFHVFLVVRSLLSFVFLYVKIVKNTLSQHLYPHS
jgi:hypothetical protein